MVDPLSKGLDSLAPDVDAESAARSFVVLRKRRKRRRQAGGGALALVLVAAVGLGILSQGGEDADTVIAGPQASTPAPTAVPIATVSEAEVPQPLTATQFDIVDEALLPDQPVDELGTVIDVVPGGGYLIQFESDTIWEYIDSRGDRTFGGAALQDQPPVLIDPIGNATVHVSCSADLVGMPDPRIGARVEAVAATGFDTRTEPISATAWLSVSCVGLDQARGVWAASGVNMYQQLYEGRIDGNRESALVRFADGRISQRRLDAAEFGTFDVESVFDLIANAEAEGQEVQAQFEPELGYPTKVVISDQGIEILDFASRSFQWAIREPGCEAGTGSALDLSQESLAQVLAGTYTRWRDPADCPVRLDVISDATGAAHCELDRARFLTIGTPVGSIPDPETARSYIFDPDRTLASIGRGEWGSVGGLELLPDSAIATGYRSEGGFELWIDEADAEYVWAVNDSTVQAWRQALEGVSDCA